MPSKTSIKQSEKVVPTALVPASSSTFLSGINSVIEIHVPTLEFAVKFPDQAKVALQNTKKPPALGGEWWIEGKKIE